MNSYYKRDRRKKNKRKKKKEKKRKEKTRDSFCFYDNMSKDKKEKKKSQKKLVQDISQNISRNWDGKYIPSDFKIKYELGSGGQSFVKLALHKPTGKYVALKILSKYYYEKRKQVTTAFTERELLRVCASPFTVKLLGSYQNANFAFLVLQYVKGTELFDLIRLSEHGFSLTILRFISAQVILFLENCHSHNVIYCDLKPENVMVRDDGYIKMVDFGLSSRLKDKNAKKQNACGTLQYYCPSKLQDEPYDLRSDIWTLGILMYEMVTNLFLYGGRTREEVLREVRTRKISYPEKSPAKENRDLQQLIASLLEFNPVARPTLEEIKRHKFFQGLSWSKLAQCKIDLKSTCWDDILAARKREVQATRKRLGLNQSSSINDNNNNKEESRKTQSSSGTTKLIKLNEKLITENPKKIPSQKQVEVRDRKNIKKDYWKKW